MEYNPFQGTDSRSAGQEFAASYVTRRLITVFTRTRHWTLSWATWMQFTSSHCFSNIILILSSHLHPGFQIGLFP